MKRILITGVNGFIGGHIVEYLVENYPHYQIIGLDNHERAKGRRGIERYFKCDLTSNTKHIMEVLKETLPNHIIHLAGVNRTNSFEEYYRVNVFGTINLFNTIIRLKSKFDPTTLIPGSAAEYGLVYKDELPISEENPLRPINFYGNSKVAQTLIGRQYQRSHDLKIHIVRMFNIIGPGQTTDYVCSHICKQIAEIEKGIKKPVLMIGNTKPKRDFVDIRDVVALLWKLSKSGGYYGEVFNVGSGKACSVAEIINILMDIAKTDIEIKEEKKALRDFDIPFQICNTAKAKKALDWTAKISIKKSLSDILEYWRKDI